MTGIMAKEVKTTFAKIQPLKTFELQQVYEKLKVIKGWDKTWE